MSNSNFNWSVGKDHDWMKGTAPRWRSARATAAASRWTRVGLIPPHHRLGGAQPRMAARDRGSLLCARTQWVPSLIPPLSSASLCAPRFVTFNPPSFYPAPWNSARANPAHAVLLYPHPYPYAALPAIMIKSADAQFYHYLLLCNSILRPCPYSVTFPPVPHCSCRLPQGFKIALELLLALSDRRATRPLEVSHSFGVRTIGASKLGAKVIFEFPCFFLFDTAIAPRLNAS
ncbi:hypothetical protein DFH07DRAFT_1064190 [Mycena maculata]|uniref:Uncharacterized protein n=1 Tax=Mycena maculata TaxID=230809 RepID=A0AAD7N0G8_9AGAR|nr:hypothetical protein DFH07DRAFT_1064190 [Mycena maculata]